MHHRRVLALVVALAVGSGLGLAACGEDDEPVSTGETSESDTAVETATPTEVPTSTPEEPSEETSEDPGEETAPLSAAQFTEQYGCGFGFYAGNADQTVAIFVTFDDFEAAAAGQVPPEGAVPSVIWSGRVEVGTDLFANWCDDVIEPGEPTPLVDETWVIEEAGIRIIGDPPVQASGALTAELTDVVIESATGERVELGDLTLTNDTWGAFAG